jgi:hypothetical protein
MLKISANNFVSALTPKSEIFVKRSLIQLRHRYGVLGGFCVGNLTPLLS